ncbi:MAG: hypothetical protein JXX28_10660 [Deltaproteobacteria bacterium]|nr:hypothetical protein [Deltaproteobacteria bacterium]
MRALRIVPVVLVIAGLAGCDMIMGSAGPEICNDAQALLRSGDLAGAEAAYEALAADGKSQLCVVTGRSYMKTLSGNYGAADKILAEAEPNAGEELGNIKLRRALVGLEEGNLDAVREHGIASGLPAGKVLAAEVHLTDLESDKAVALLKEASSAGGQVGQTASRYLEMLEAGGAQAGMAEVTALWALNRRADAVETVVELVGMLPEDENKSAQLLIWASRAVTSGKPDVARELLDSIDFPPEGQGWRVQAIRAMADVADGDGAAGLETFKKLAAGGAPADGLADAMATAACLTEDKAIAKELVGEQESYAGARCLSAVGAGGVAKRVVPAGTLKTFLESR